MSPIEIALVLVGITGLVFSIIAAGSALERRAARRLASPILGQPCPSCGWSLQSEAIRSARLEHPFDGPSYASVVCPGCSKRWALLEHKWLEEPL